MDCFSIYMTISLNYKDGGGQKKSANENVSTPKVKPASWAALFKSGSDASVGKVTTVISVNYPDTVKKEAEIKKEVTDQPSKIISVEKDQNALALAGLYSVSYCFYVILILVESYTQMHSIKSDHERFLKLNGVTFWLHWILLISFCDQKMSPFTFSPLIFNYFFMEIFDENLSLSFEQIGFFIVLILNNQAFP